MPTLKLHKIRISMPMTENVMEAFVIDERLPGIMKKAEKTGAVVETLLTRTHELTNSKAIFDFMETKAYVPPKHTGPRKFSWFDVLPSAVAKRQIMWERNRMAYQMAKLNIPRKEIARKLGVTPTRVGHILVGFQWRYDPDNGREPRLNPAQEYLKGNYREDINRMVWGYKPWEYL